MFYQTGRAHNISRRNWKEGGDPEDVPLHLQNQLLRKNKKKKKSVSSALLSFPANVSRSQTRSASNFTINHLLEGSCSGMARLSNRVYGHIWQAGFCHQAPLPWRLVRRWSDFTARHGSCLGQWQLRFPFKGFYLLVFFFPCCCCYFGSNLLPSRSFLYPFAEVLNFERISPPSVPCLLRFSLSRQPPVWTQRW